MASELPTIRAKRPRTDDDPEIEDAVVRSGEVWYDDGNIILQAQNVQFKIYKGVLIKQSSVFAGMFDLPHVVPGDESVDDCPIIHMSDSAEDLKHALQALYDKSYFRVQKMQHFAAVAGCLRIGTKYEIGCLREDAIQVLKYQYPDTLAGYDQSLCSPTGIFHLPGLDFGVTNLGEETGVPDILRAAYLGSARRTAKEILCGFDWGGPMCTLLPQHQTTCLIAREALIGQLLSDMADWTLQKDTSSLRCTSPDHCDAERRAVFEFYGTDPCLVVSIMHPSHGTLSDIRKKTNFP